MKELIFIGKILQVSEVVSEISKKGEWYTKRNVLMQTDEEWPQTLLATLIGEKATSFTGQVGQTASAYIKFSTYAGADGKMYNSIRCWKIEVYGKEAIA